MKWAALALTLFLMGLALYFVFFIGSMPGRVAAERNHPKAEAIKIGGWATLILGCCGLALGADVGVFASCSRCVN